jgi:hypothetical protein
MILSVTLTREIERLIVVAAVPILLWIGYQLFLRGATGQMTLSADSKTVKGKATNLAPGSLCFLLAASLGGYILFSKVSVSNFDNAGGVTSITSFLGQTRGERLSLAIRRVLSEETLALMSAGNDEAMRADVSQRLLKKLRRIPLPEDLKRIEEAEQNTAHGDTNAIVQLQEFRQLYTRD